MSYGQVFKTISDEPQETDVLELLRTGAEVARKNAHKHGLTAELARKSVLDWYRIILHDPTADLPVIDALNDEPRLAVNLARAEVRLRSVLHAIDEFEQEHDPLLKNWQIKNMIINSTSVLHIIGV